ncbi:hypothetical protein BABINDRAFT_160186 [Babjeviella inositovora NRRL Y-12698]|uniref:Uncharacterized protein n=1 Tax=Babjeviella inositovora NRRL Y-12698 TaxID=984486 RepID=A0A1E3QWG6_9ASCO|nr:uncharacterized protein BABINDRAFT_160186 [Babjeviella inositovora NRRL Y-12698]ODQ81971.1 hypothetical protein BABINDRAFT_160186 [Babjeviella inositovora NRRL Y-12698]
MDRYYWHYLEKKKRIFHEYGDTNIASLPESDDACLELVETVRAHILKRYPLLFQSNDGIIVYNNLTDEVLDMTESLKEHPLI